MRKIRSQEVAERRQYETHDDLSIPDFLRRPFIPAPAPPLDELPAGSFRGTEDQVTDVGLLQSGQGA